MLLANSSLGAGFWGIAFVCEVGSLRLGSLRPGATDDGPYVICQVATPGFVTVRDLELVRPPSHGAHLVDE